MVAGPRSSAPDPRAGLAADASLAARLAGDAVTRLTALRDRHRRDDPAGALDVDAVRDAGDRSSHEFLLGAFTDERPGDAVLSEEGADDPSRLDADRVWIVDPLDGTREFGEGRSDWAVHVALWVRGHDGPAGQLAVGAVGLPDGVTLVSDPAPPLPPAPSRPPRVVASRTRAPAVVADVVAALSGEQVPLGSAGAKIAAVVRGDADAYVHAGGMWEWDSAAPVAVARAAGLTAVRLDGSPLVYNQPRPYLPDLVVCRPELTDRILDVVRASSSG